MREKVLAGALLAALLAFSTAPRRAAPAEVHDAITYASTPGVLYLPVREAGEALDWSVRWNPETETAYLRDEAVSEGSMRRLLDGTALVPIRDLEQWGARVTWDSAENLARVSYEDREFAARAGQKRVVINKPAQRMRAWQGDRLVLDTRVSTGRPSKPTPSGRYRAGPLKTPMLISRRYDDARMPWSVQIYGNYVIHGFRYVPRYSASHGCVRVPLTGGNPAKWFYHWVEVGTPIRIGSGWS